MHDPRALASDPEFSHEPLVLGRLGPGTDDRVDDLARRMGLRRFVAEPGLTIHASTRLRRVRGSAPGWYWNPHDPLQAVRDAGDIRHRARAMGVIGGSGWKLVNDALGIQPLNHMELDGSVVFSNWLPALRPLLANVRPDPVGWAGQLLLGAPMPGSSLVLGIHTLPPASELRLGSAGVEVVRHDVVDPIDAPVDDLVEALVEHLPPRRRRLAVTLSGGWDSRLLAGLLVGVGRRVEAWTTSPDDGRDLDVELSRPVARRLGIAQRIVLPGPETWPDSAAEARRRFAHTTWMHPWLMPLGAQLRDTGLDVVDGLGGDVLLKGLFQDVTRDSMGRDESVRRALHDKLGAARLAAPTWSPAAISLGEVGWEAFEEVVAPFAAMEQWQALSVLVTRTARCIALSPYRIFGPEARVWTPFLSGDVLRTSLGAIIHSRRGDDFYRTLLDRVAPGLGELPSTNDPGGSSPPVPRRQATPGAVAALVRGIRRVEPALDLLGEDLRGLLVAGDVTGLEPQVRRSSVLAALQAVATFADWYETWDAEDSLV